MKKLLLITFLFLITPDAKADMDYVCGTFWDSTNEYITDNCERNNILHMLNIPQFLVLEMSAHWCRQDREINMIVKDPDSIEKLGKLVCVLYDNKPRKLIRE